MKRVFRSAVKLHVLHALSGTPMGYSYRPYVIIHILGTSSKKRVSGCGWTRMLSNIFIVISIVIIIIMCSLVLTSAHCIDSSLHMFSFGALPPNCLVPLSSTIIIGTLGTICSGIICKVRKAGLPIKRFKPSSFNLQLKS